MSGGELALRIFLPCYFVAYILIGGPLNVARFRKKYGIDPVPVQVPDPIMVLGEAYRNVLFALALVMVLVHAVHPPLLACLVPIPYLVSPAIQGAGVAILVGALVLLRASQLHLKSSWRYGIDRAGPLTELVTTGLYSWSRNPIYVGMSATGVGLFLALPNALSFAIANLTFLLLAVRIRVEEEYLGQRHGEAYAAYRKRTPRWLVRLGSDE